MDDSGAPGIRTDVADLSGVLMGEMRELMATEPELRACLARVLAQTDRGGNGEVVAGFNSSL